MDGTRVGAALPVTSGNLEAHTDGTLPEDYTECRHKKASRAEGQSNSGPVHLGGLDIRESRTEPFADDGQQVLRCEREKSGIAPEDSQGAHSGRIVGHVAGLGHRPATRRGRPHFQAP